MYSHESYSTGSLLQHASFYFLYSTLFCCVPLLPYRGHFWLVCSVFRIINNKAHTTGLCRKHSVLTVSWLLYRKGQTSPVALRGLGMFKFMDSVCTFSLCGHAWRFLKLSSMTFSNIEASIYFYFTHVSVLSSYT